MAKKKPVRMRTVVQRVNQKLSAKGQILIRATRWMKLKVDFGDYYILDLSGNVVDTHIDPEKLARKLRVLNEGEKSDAQLGQNDNRSGPLVYIPPERCGLIWRQRFHTQRQHL